MTEKGLSVTPTGPGNRCADPLTCYFATPDEPHKANDTSGLWEKYFRKKINCQT